MKPFLATVRMPINVFKAFNLEIREEAKQTLKDHWHDYNMIIFSCDNNIKGKQLQALKHTPFYEVDHYFMAHPIEVKSLIIVSLKTAVPRKEWPSYCKKSQNCF